MTVSTHKKLMLASSLAILAALAGCGRSDQFSGDKSDPVASRAKEEALDAAARARAASNKLGESTKSMGAGVAEKADDASITAKVNAAFATDKDLSSTRIDVDTKGGVVTLTGPAPSAQARERATDIARHVKGVSSVNNNLVVKTG